MVVESDYPEAPVGIGGKLEMDDCSKLPLLADALRREGFTEDEVERIFYRNAQRFFEDNL